MPFSIPSSLSPHIAILTSQDLDNLLKSSSLPPLPHILQSFSPLPQVTTRTTSLVSIPHPSFTLRFSALNDLEVACQENDDQRAVRTLDWITARIANRSVKWVQDADKLFDKEGLRTPWWDELRRCAEGDFVPSKSESWNHPVALILAVSTTAPNPLQAITALHSRALQFPPWVDTNFLRYTLIIHPQDSALSDEEAGALFNAVKKQFGLHSYLLSLNLPKPPPKPIPVPALMPRLPSPPSPDSPPQNSITPVTATIPTTPAQPTTLNTLSMEEKDIQQTARFTREFLVMSLVPWMEKCVVDWNENFSSTRRLPSRLFSSTRRLFGSPSPSPSPAPVQVSSSVASLPGRSSVSSMTNDGLGPPSQMRRLAEFATILGDYKLAAVVWEALRKESKGGSDILPMLLTPSPTIPLHASTALTSIHPNSTEVPPHAQVRALLCAIRWEAGISSQDFISNVLEGERWLVWAAGNAEEAPSALLLAQAALLSAKKQAKRRAALWYISAAARLEKCGIKSLTMYFLRKAQGLYSIPLPKELSPSFWDSEGKSAMGVEGLEDILSGIEHPLGRILYTTGDVAGAVRLFLGLVRGSAAFSYNARLLQDTTAKIPGNDKLYLDDFRVAYSYFKSTEPEKVGSTLLQLPIKLCTTPRLRLRFLGDHDNGDNDVWSAREEDWKAFWKSHGGKESVAKAGKVSTNELFWVDLVFQNPLDTEVNLSNLTLNVQASHSTDDSVDVEIIKEVTLGAKETSLIPVSLKAKVPTQLSITHAKYDFLGLLSVTEPLASRGRRLHDTPLQRQQPTYAPDVIIQMEVVASHHKLVASYIEDEQLVLMQGENKSMRLWLTNAGSRPIGEVWMVAGAEDEIWIGAADNNAMQDSMAMTEVIRSQNSLEPQKPYRLSISDSQLEPGNGVEVPFILHAQTTGSHELCLLFVFRENDTQLFYSTKLTRSYDVHPLFDISISAEPSQALDHSYILNADIVNVSMTAEVELVQISCLSPLWTAMSLTDSKFGVIAPLQCFRSTLGVSSWSEGSGSRETLDFVSRKLRHLLQGKDNDPSAPPHIDMHCSHVSKTSRQRTIQGAAIMHFIQSGRRKFASRTIAHVHSYIPPTSHPSIFPLYNPNSFDMIVFWTIPLQNISGHINVHGIVLGAGHAALDSIIEEAESAKVKRSMYAETRRENMEVLDAIRGSEWNVEMNPIVLSLQDMGTAKVHDFSKGPFILPLEFLLRNHSPTHPAQYILNLLSKSTMSRTLPYQGRLTFRGIIQPSQSVIVQPKVWITRSGSYELGGWTLETEINTVDVADPTKSTRKRRYIQEPQSSEGVRLVVCDPRTP